ncbi:uncharacterized protein LOC135849433 [Planococcus citri]|uniref:uncharacterized protein LOC135849433 n=1 Tax=Planococcus citri TaxID=170843 RepID=UPI0031F806C0
MKTSFANVGKIHAILIVLFSLYEIAECIDCYKCVSLNWQNSACDDPFHTNYTLGILESPCMGGRKGRNGLFPATACIKLTGKYSDNGDHITVRGCALDSGTLTTDTEIIRMSHCGGFFFDDRYVRGCLQSCDDADGCNTAKSSKYIDYALLITIMSGWFSSINF